MVEHLTKLEEKTRDRWVALSKGALGAIPLAGGILAEIVGALIPNQRLDRVAEMLGELALRVDALEQGTKERLHSEEFIDLLEDGMVQASRARTPRRRHAIADLLANALADITLDHLYKKHLLQLFGELNDAELIILRGLYKPAIGDLDAEFLEQNRRVLQGPAAHMDASIEELERSVYYESFMRHLVNQGLISLREDAKRMWKSAFPPAFDKYKGTPNYELTPIGSRIVRITRDATL